MGTADRKRLRNGMCRIKTIFRAVFTFQEIGVKIESKIFTSAFSFHFLYLVFTGPCRLWQASGSRGSSVKLWRLPACWERRLNSPAWLQGSTFGPHISHIQDEGATASVGWGCVGWDRFTRVSVGSAVEKGLSGVAGNAFRNTYNRERIFCLFFF